MARIVSCLLAAAMAVFSSAAAAQITNASLAGTVRDSSGAVVANATVTVHNINTGVDRTVPSNNVGAYLFPSLITGTYTLKVSAAGFRDETINGILLQIDQQARIDVALQVGTVGQNVTVSGAPPLLQTEDASVGTVVGGNQVVSLPLNGRSFTQLLQ
jgi:hypothetical protein